ncbi:hypothetical protein KO481_03870 [Nocardia sp. NEAU-G5]|uniref:DUF4232 domain-containing protein n=1 Tax=Nocardia albiluteola TaxID=2842303 RepID=A0ABS6AUD4_9NOCA|nr:hypothetical protein [Nocardia albiluteola]MBU3060658.1 hypothetical protein [Nocardia albiluteola]
MLEPNGPLPPEIYWRRRALAIGAIVVALALVIWLAIMLLHSGGGKAASKAAATLSSASTTPSASATSSAAATPSGTAAAGTSTPSGSVNATAAGTPAPCPDQSLAVKVTVGQPTYKAGQQPVFGIVITNISTAACSRDMGSGLQQVSVQSLDGQRRLWTSTDCDSGGAPDVRTLNGGQQAAFTLTWSGTTSQAACAGERVPVPAGAYAVSAQFGSIHSAPEPFNIG